MNSDLHLPPPFVNQMRHLLGVYFDSFSNALKQPSPVSIRFNPHKVNNRSIASPVPWCTTGAYLNERPSFTLDPAFHGGAYYVQEASSMFLEQALKQTTDLSKSLNVLDLCAAPGGKSTHILSLINQESLLVCNEVIRSRAAILSENIQKWGHNNVVVTNNDPEDFKRLKGFFDVIVVDAPCSGEGLFRKEPEAMGEWSIENVALCWKRQRRILSEVWPSLKSGGMLIYSTCTYNRLENEDNLAWLKDQYDAAFVSLNLETSWGVQEVSDDGLRGYHFYPHLTKGEGFFMAAIQKTSDEDSIHVKPKDKVFQRPAAKVIDKIKDWVSGVENKTFLQWKESLLIVPAVKQIEIEFIARQLHVIATGTMLGELKHEKIIPDHALALSLSIKKDLFPALNVTLEQAQQYLRKEAFYIPKAKKGFTLITYEDLPLGWVNVLDNRFNNLYPANWRIRMQKQ